MGSRPLLALSVCALASAGVYLLFLVAPYPLATLYAAPLLDLGKAAGYQAGHALAFAAGFGAEFALYIAAYRIARRLEVKRATDESSPRASRRALGVILGGAALCALALMWVYPVGAVDVYDYAFRARMWNHYGLNPQSVAPQAVSADAWYPYVAWIWYPSPYGPLWTLITAALNQLAGDSLLLNLLALKGLAATSAIASAVLVFILLRNSGRALSGALLFAWNPLVLFESAVNGHNDVAMMLLVLAACWLHQKRHFSAALVACVLAAHIKIAALALAPALWLAALFSDRNGGRGWTPRLRWTLEAAVGVALASIAVYASLWSGWQTFDGMQAQEDRFTSSAATVVALGLDLFMARGWGEYLARELFVWMFAGVSAWRLWRAARAHERLARTAFAQMWLVLAVVTLWFEPWYAVWLVALAPLAGGAARRLSVALSAGALSLYLLFGFFWFWQPEIFNAGDQLVVNAIALVLWLGAPAMVWWRDTHRRSAGLPQCES